MQPYSGHTVDIQWTKLSASHSHLMMLDPECLAKIFPFFFLKRVLIIAFTLKCTPFVNANIEKDNT